MKPESWRTACETEVGKPYIWGAEGPDAYDCSGFAQWALKKINLDPPGDQTAAGLHRFFSAGRSDEVSVAGSAIGDIVFFGSDEGVTHVALAWGGGQMLEAGGGGNKTTSVAIAREKKAEVRIRAIALRKNLIAVLRPHALPWRHDASGAVIESPAGVMAESPRGVMPETPAGPGHYTNAPPLTEWLDDGRHVQLKRPFGYVQESGREWPVPADVIVDGASIPQVFWSLVGGPFEGPYRNASVVHDYYCDVKTRPWPDTHRVFYDGMLCSGVGKVRAKVMYYAVYRFGPRWTVGPAAVAEGFGATGAALTVASLLPVESFDADSFEADASLIQAQDLDLASIEALADAHGADRPAAATGVAAEVDAALARQPVLERLVALQDAALDAASAESVGALMARYAAGARVTTPQPITESGLALGDLRASYESLYAACTICPERAAEVAWHRKKLLQYRARYEAVEARTGAPWWFVGIVHALEASFNFNGHLHNGDPLTGRTVQVPKNRPAVWLPPSDWESSAIDSLACKNLVGQADWRLATALHRFESYNGFGYYAKNINSPYLWSFSNQYTKGKYVADHRYDPAAVSKQCGAAVMLKALEVAGTVAL